MYLSAEDVFRPFVPARYIETKRETERTIWREVAASRGVGQVAQDGVEGVKHARAIRPLFVRPSKFSAISSQTMGVVGVVCNLRGWTAGS